MNSIIISRLQTIEDNTHRNLGIIDLIITRSFITNWLLINILVNVIFDTVITTCVVVLSICNYINRNKKLIIFINMSYIICRFISLSIPMLY
ncbi:hypothetical protein [Turkeypox virus]|uniref:Uncharacterized protein n=1 Tax=Turkeypox virus TaxID=336486 RepID=A0A0M3PB58_9POXV|nr:hypothetical protein ASN15_gp092 [Turkeypox virus]ALA62466.1 hypothetical protein [Turkeypox virus]